IVEIAMHRFNFLSRRFAKGAVIAAFAASALLPGLAFAAKPPPPPVIPPEIAQITVPDDGSAPKFLGYASGTQDYQCQLTTSGTSNGGSGAIPWLLLDAVSSTAGPDGGDVMLDIVHIQRVNTTGGLAPTSLCDGTTVGIEQDVPYTATYYFYHFTS